MLVTLIGFALAFGLVFSRIGLPPMVGFLLAGFAYNMAGLTPPEGLQRVANLGITLMLFSIGLKLDLRGLAKPEIWANALAHIVLSSAFFAGVLWLGQQMFPIPLLDVPGWTLWVLGFALSFSSTVFAAKVLEDKGDICAFYGKLAIGVLVMQDIFAVVFLAVSEGKYPGWWALLVLALPFVRPALFRLLDAAGKGELLILSGLFFALGVGGEFFYAVGLKPDLGSLVVGVLFAGHPKASNLSKSLFNFKELLLVGFFLSVGMQGLPTGSMVLVALLLCLLLPFKTALYFVIAARFGLRARTALYSSMVLANYSEFGLIVAALGVTQGWLPVDWLLLIAIAVSMSFALASPLTAGTETLYQRFKGFWTRFQTQQLHPNERAIEVGKARVLVIGMGRIGTGAYDELAPAFDHQVLGIEHDTQRVESLGASGRNVLVGDATDTDFWNKLKTDSHLALIVLAMPNHHSNLYAARQIRAARMTCKVAAVAQHEEEVGELEALGVAAFNMYSEAGSGLALRAVASWKLKE